MAYALKLVMDSIEDDRPYAATLKKKFGDKFDELIEKLHTCKDIASLNGIPSESNALHCTSYNAYTYW